MRFQKPVEQHRIHCIVTHRVNVAVLVAHDEIGIHLGYFICNQTKLWRVRLIALVVKVTGLSAKIVSLDLSIGWIAFLFGRFVIFKTDGSVISPPKRDLPSCRLLGDTSLYGGRNR